MLRRLKKWFARVNRQFKVDKGPCAEGLVKRLCREVEKTRRDSFIYDGLQESPNVWVVQIFSPPSTFEGIRRDVGGRLKAIIERAQERADLSPVGEIRAELQLAGRLPVADGSWCTITSSYEPDEGLQDDDTRLAGDEATFLDGPRIDLLVRLPGQEMRLLQLFAGCTLTAGRDAGSDIVLGSDNRISRRHFLLHLTDDLNLQLEICGRNGVEVSEPTGGRFHAGDRGAGTPISLESGFILNCYGSYIEVGTVTRSC